MLFPPRRRQQLHREVLDELIEEQVVRVANRRNHRGVKRKMSKFPIRCPGADVTHKTDVTVMIVSVM